MAFLSQLKRSFGNTFSFFVESWAELKKVRWPNRKEMTSYTIVVIAVVAFITVYFAVVDLGLSKLLRVSFE